MFKETSELQKTDKETVNSSATSPLIFSAVSSSNTSALSQSIKDQEVKAFIRLVVEGEQDQAEELLKKTPELALRSGDVTDLSERTFKNITGFQYAVWAIDWHMWTMLLNYLPKDTAREQYEAMPKGAWVIQHGQSASWKNLTDALQKCVGLCKKGEWTDASTCWNREVGGAQRLLPAHVINEYCQPSRRFEPCPDFNSTMPLLRTRKTGMGNWHTVGKGKHKFYKLGESFAYLRYDSFSEPAVLNARGYGDDIYASTLVCGAGADLNACLALYNTRTQQRDQLFAELTVGVQQRFAATK